MKKYTYMNAASLLMALFVNYLANAVPLNGKTTGELSDALPNLFVPTGLTFAIWGLIYTLLIAAVVKQFIDSRNNRAQYVEIYGSTIAVSNLLNALWIFAWHYQLLIASLLIMLALLVTLIMLYLRIEAADLSGFRKLPYSVYLGWISVATIANVTAVLVYYGITGYEVFWTLVTIAAATGLAVVMCLRHRDYAYALVVVWALIGIFIKRLNSTPVYMPIVYGSALCTGLILACIIFKMTGRNGRRQVL